MPKKPKFKNNLTRVREGLGLSQAEFARKLGVSASIIKKIEAGKRKLSQELSAAIFAETGRLLLSSSKEEPLEYTREDYAVWKKEVLLDQKSVKAAERVITKLIELMMAASVRPGVEKSYVVFHGLIQAIERVKNDFQMEKHIDAELRDRQATETKLYSVGELRKNDLLAKQVGFKDDSNLKDEDQIPLTKSVGWLPAKEMFNIERQHQEFLRELGSSDVENLTEAQKTELAEIEKQRDSEIDAFLLR